MKTENLDVVYFCRDGANEELRYSLRSLDKNFKFNSVWIYGGKPDYITPDHFVKINQTGRTKWDKVRAMFGSVCLNGKLSENFVLMNDDFFIMKKTDSLEPVFRCSLFEHIVTVEGNFGDRPTNYTAELRKATRRLQEAGLDTNSYELHVPMIFNRKKLLETMGAFPDVHATRSLYGNYVGVGGKQMSDVKIYEKNTPVEEFENNRFLSTQDSIWMDSNVARYIKESFKERSRFEK